MTMHQRRDRTPGPTQAAFERRVGMKQADWIKANAHRYTLTEAAAHIGYSTPGALRVWMDSNQLDATFAKRRKERKK